MTDSRIESFLAGAIAKDASGGSLLISTNAPEIFPLGSTIVTFSATDVSDNTGTATSTVTVIDQSDPVVTVPASITVAAIDASGTPRIDTSIQAFLGGATARDNLDGVVTPVGNNAPATFPLGTTTVTFSATDTSGNTGIATSTVTVTDQSNPVVTVPASITVAAIGASGIPRTDVIIQTFLGRAMARDNVDGVITPVVNNAPENFPLGRTTVTFSATDASGKTGTATSTVTVADQSNPVVTAPASITIPAMNVSGIPKTDTSIQPFLDGVMADDDVDGVITPVRNSAPATFALGITTVIFRATDAAGNTDTAISSVRVTDQTAPVVTAAASITVAAIDASGTPKTDTIIQTFLGGATARDNVDRVITPVTNNAPATFPLGVTTITFSATDAAGNTDIAISTVTVTDQSNPVVTAPASITIPAMNVSGIPKTDTSIQPFLDGVTADDDVDGVITPVRNDAPAIFPPGITIVTFSATDVSGNTGIATATVTVTELDNPIITPPAPITVAAIDVSGTPKTDLSIQPFLGAATARNNIDGVITPVTNNAPATFPLGITTVIFSATDTSEKTGTATSTVTVRDETLPVVTPPPGITVNATSIRGIRADNIAIQVFLAGATAIDNIDGVIAAPTNSTREEFFVGTTTVIFSATDATGNVGTATATVTVLALDSIPPVVTAPSNISVTAEGPDGTPKSNNLIQTFLAGASATDKVDGEITPITNDAPATFSLGTTTVTFSATDLAGNPGIDTATVTVTSALASGAGYSIVFVGPGIVNGIGTNSDLTATFDSIGTLLSTVNLFGQPTGSIGTWQTSELVSDGIASVGRWNNGTGTLKTSTITLTPNQGLHYAIGIPTPSSSIPASGVRAYTLSGGTHPIFRDGSVVPGILTGEVVVDFSAKKLGINLTIILGGETYTITTTGSTKTPEASEVIFFDHVSGILGQIDSGFNSPVVSSPTCFTGPGGCFANIEGFLFGLAGEELGLGIRITGNTLPLIDAAAIFKSVP